MLTTLLWKMIFHIIRIAVNNGGNSNTSWRDIQSGRRADFPVFLCPAHPASVPRACAYPRYPLGAQPVCRVCRKPAVCGKLDRYPQSASRPVRMSRPCRRSPMINPMLSRTALGLPGRLIISVRPESPPFMSGVYSSTFQSTLPSRIDIYKASIKMMNFRQADVLQVQKQTRE